MVFLTGLEAGSGLGGDDFFQLKKFGDMVIESDIKGLRIQEVHVGHIEVSIEVCGMLVDELLHQVHLVY